MVVVKDSFLRAHILVSPQFTESPEAERKRLVCRYATFAIKNERIIGPLDVRRCGSVRIGFASANRVRP